MWSRLFRIVVAGLLMITVSGCILSRLTDRGFLGFGDPPKYKHRIYTGLFLLPIAAVVDLVTSPIQFLLLVIIGDDFPFGHDAPTKGPAVAQRIETDKRLAKLPLEQRAALRDYLVQRARSGQPMPTSVGLAPDGTWFEVPVDESARRKLLARAHGCAPLRTPEQLPDSARGAEHAKQTPPPAGK